jgi:hypothetical protein
MAWYRAGSIAVANGSKNVTGTGTAWVNNVQPGDAFIGPDGAYYEIDLVGSNTGLVLVENYAGTTVASGGVYRIIPTQGRVRDMAAHVLQLLADYGAVESALTVAGGRVGIGRVPGGAEQLDVAGRINADALQVTAGTVNQTSSQPATYHTSLVENSSSTGYAQLQFNIGASGANGQAGMGYAPGIAYFVGPFANDTTTPLILRNNNGTERMRITPTGRVGIGTSSPNVELDLIAANNGGLMIRSASDAHASHLYFADTVNASGYIGYSHDDNGMVFGTNDAARMTITATGRIGINTLTPNVELDVVVADNSGAMIRSDSVTHTGHLFFASIGTPGAIRYAHATDSMSFIVGGTPRATLDAAGNVILSAPAAPPTLTANGTAVMNLTSNTNLRISARGSDGTTRVANITLA